MQKTNGLGVLVATLSTVVGLGASSVAFAAYPERPVTVIVPYAPGGTADIITRIVANAMSKELDTPFIVENKPGGSGSIGVGVAARAAQDGYTLLSSSSEISLSATGKTPLTAEVVSKLVPLARMATSPMVLVAASKEHSLLDWRALAQKDAGSVTYATPGVMTPMHLVMTQISAQTDMPVFHIPYNGGSRALADLIGGQVDLLAVALGTTLSQIKSGQVQSLAVLYSQSTALLPGTPTISEALQQEVEAIPATWFGWFAPLGTSDEIQSQLKRALVQVASDETVKKQMLAAGLEPALLEGEAFTDELVKEEAYYKKAVELLPLDR